MDSYHRFSLSAMRDAYTVDKGDESEAMKFVSIFSPQDDVNIETINADHLTQRARFQFSWDQFNVGSFHLSNPVAVYTVIIIIRGVSKFMGLPGRNHRG